jgi:hypothetical protein
LHFTLYKFCVCYKQGNQISRTSQVLALDRTKPILILLTIHSQETPDTTCFHPSNTFAVSFSTKPPELNTNAEKVPTAPGCLMRCGVRVRPWMVDGSGGPPIALTEL